MFINKHVHVHVGCTLQCLETKTRYVKFYSHSMSSVKQVEAWIQTRIRTLHLNTFAAKSTQAKPVAPAAAVTNTVSLETATEQCTHAIQKQMSIRQCLCMGTSTLLTWQCYHRANKLNKSTAKRTVQTHTNKLGMTPRSAHTYPSLMLAFRVSVP